MPGLVLMIPRFGGRICHLLFAAVLFSMPLAEQAAADEGGEPDLYSINEMGGVGLLQTRTARFQPDGTLELGASFINPYRHYYINMQIVPWLEVNFRYTDITNQSAAGLPIEQSQSQFWNNLLHFRGGDTLLDRGLDIKVRLREEGTWMPAIAAGVQDALGTGLFGGEYIVASKRFRRLDVHLGMGWGYLGNRGFLPNPLKLLGGRFDQRDADVGTGGKVSLGNFFAGKRVALFGGIEYITPINGLSLKMEYSGTDPALEARGGVLAETVPIGVGFNYRPTSWFDLSLGFERGNTVMFRTAFRTNLLGRGIPKNEPSQPRLRTRLPEGEIDLVQESVDLTRAGKADLEALYADLGALELYVASLEINVVDARLSANGDAAGDASGDATGDVGGGDWEFRAARILFRYLPLSIFRVEIRALGPGGEGGVIFTRASIEFVDEVDEGLSFRGPAGDVVSHNELEELVLQGRRLDVLFREDAGQSFAVKDASFAAAALADIREIRFWRQGQIMASVDLLAVRIERQTSDMFTEVESGGFRAVEIRLSSDSLRIYSADSVAPVPGSAGGGGGGPSLSRAARAIGLRQASLLKPQNQDSEDRTAGAVAGRIFADLQAAGFTGYAVNIQEPTAAAEIYVSKTRYLQIPRNLGWVGRIAANHLPPDIEWITVVQMEKGIEVSRIGFLRSDIERHDRGRGSPEETWQHAEIGPTGRVSLGSAGERSDDTILNGKAYPETSWWLGPALLQHIGDPDTGIYLADLYASLGGSFSPMPGLQITGEFRQFIVGNLDTIERASESVLPRVRSDIARYLQEGRSAITRLQLDYITSLGPDLYVRASAGMFERMFGGVGGEILYRPVDQRWAVGADLNWVRQRNFNQLFGFQSYDVVTGHVDFYYDWPYYDIRTIVSAGRYLAGDKGVTIDISRRFESGVRVGAFATFTDVSAVDFGEGSFDKGFYLSVPLEALLPMSSRERSMILFRPLSRDGGQRLIIGSRLFQIVDDANEMAVRRDWARIFE